MHNYVFEGMINHAFSTYVLNCFISLFTLLSHNLFPFAISFIAVAKWVSTWCPIYRTGVLSPVKKYIMDLMSMLVQWYGDVIFLFTSGGYGLLRNQQAIWVAENGLPARARGRFVAYHWLEFFLYLLINKLIYLLTRSCIAYGREVILWKVAAEIWKYGMLYQLYWIATRSRCIMYAWRGMFLVLHPCSLEWISG